MGRKHFVDLSISIEAGLPSDPPMMIPKIDYVTHEMGAEQMKMFLTRLGVNSKAIITGDVTQIDLLKKEHSGLVQIQEILKNIKDISFVYFNKSDVVRHKLVKDIIDAYEKFNDSK